MGLIIKKERHLFTRLPLLFILILFLTFSPIIVGILGASISEWMTGEQCHEGNCAWMVLPWFAIFSIPVGGLLLLVYIVIVLIDTINLKKS